MGHAILSPSSAKRWLACAGSVPATLGQSTDSEFADEGTAAHTLAAWALREKRPAASYIGTEIPVMDDHGKIRRMYKVDDDMASYVQVYIDTIMDKVTAEDVLLVEQHVESGLTSMIYGAVSGTSDVIILKPTAKRVVVSDLKFGRGVRVDAPDNPQLRIYGLGAIALLESFGYDLRFYDVQMEIVQPRADHYSDEVLSVIELTAWGERVQATIDNIDNGDTTLTPTEDGCRFCPAKASCGALAKFTMDTVFSEFKEPIADLTDWGIGKAMDKVELIEQWCTAIRAAARQGLEKGENVVGWKLVETRQGNRKFTDEEAAATALREHHFSELEIYESKLRTPAKLDKLLKANPEAKAALEPLIVRGDPAIALVRATDPRQMAGTSAAGYFK